MCYEEIKLLHLYCLKQGIDAKLDFLYDGYKITFPNGGDFVQHQFSYGSDAGFVEPAIGCRADYNAVSLENAKRLIRRHKERLNGVL